MELHSKDMYNIDLATRQTEINEWSYGNKMDLLFVLQLTFLCITFITILLYLYNIHIIGWTLVMYTIAVLVLIIAIIFMNRYSYTSITRDKRLWNRRNFVGDHDLASPAGASAEYMKEIKDAYGPRDPPAVVAAAEAGYSCSPK
jgi:hypothetical protein